MSIVAPLSKFKKNGFKIYISVCLVVAAVLAYDGYLSKYEWSKRQKFYKEHVLENEGVPDATMVFNQYVPFGLIVAALGLAGRFFMVKDWKLVLDENELAINGKYSIACDRIEQIDRTHFEKKGYFVMRYKNKQGSETDLKLSDRAYDNMEEVLEGLIGKIS